MLTFCASNRHAEILYTFSYSDLYLENVLCLLRLFKTACSVETSEAEHLPEQIKHTTFSIEKYLESELPALEKQNGPAHVAHKGIWLQNGGFWDWWFGFFFILWKPLFLYSVATYSSVNAS